MYISLYTAKKIVFESRFEDVKLKWSFVNSKCYSHIAFDNRLSPLTVANEISRTELHDKDEERESRSQSQN